MLENLCCPFCKSTDTSFKSKAQVWECNECEERFENQLKNENLLQSNRRLFISYGHDLLSDEVVEKLQKDLAEYNPWVDKNEIRTGDEWRERIANGLHNSSHILALLSKHSTRKPGVCRQEIAIALNEGKANIYTILLEPETEVTPPLMLSHLQWLNMKDWEEKKKLGKAEFESWYESKLNEIKRVLTLSEPFSGEIETLKKWLSPIDNVSEMIHHEKNFIGREWLLGKVAQKWDPNAIGDLQECEDEPGGELEEWRTHQSGKRIFWLVGEPGSGKSAIVARLSHSARARVIAVHFCRYDQPIRRNAKNIICSIAWQMATRLGDYRTALIKVLERYPDLSELNPSELFDMLLANPLRYELGGGRTEADRHLIVIDALDETLENGQSDLLDLISEEFRKLPNWIGLVVTSRPELVIQRKMQIYGTHEIKANSTNNLEDAEQYIHAWLSGKALNKINYDLICRNLMKASQGNFLYLTRVKEIVEHESSLVEDFLIEKNLPQGIYGLHEQLFNRQFKDKLPEYEDVIKPFISLMLACQELLKFDQVKDLLNWDNKKLYLAIESLGSLCVADYSSQTIKFFHKSIPDWLQNPSLSAPNWHISSESGHALFSEKCKKYLEMSDWASVDHYVIQYSIVHFVKAQEWACAVAYSTDFNWISERILRGQFREMLSDYQRLIDDLPELSKDKKNRLKEIDEVKIWMGGGDAPSSSLLLMDDNYSNFSEADFSVSESEKVKSFSKFVFNLGASFSGVKAGQIANLQDQNLIRTIIIQQALNTSLNNPVRHFAKNLLSEIKNPILIRDWRYHRLNVASESCVATFLIREKLEDAKVTNNDIFMNPYGQYIAIARRDGSIAVITADNGNMVLYGKKGERPSKKAIDISAKTAKGHYLEVFQVVISENERFVVSSSADQTVRVWSMADGSCMQVYGPVGHHIKSLDNFLGENEFICGDENGVVRAWKISDEKPILEIETQLKNIKSLSVDKSSRRWVVASRDGELVLFDGLIKEPLASYQFDDLQIGSISLLKGGVRCLVGGNDGSLRTIEFSEYQKEIQNLKAHTGKVLTVDTTPDGLRAVSAGEDKVIKVWNLENGVCERELIGHSFRITSVKINPHGNRIISTSLDGAVKIWDLRPPNQHKFVEADSLEEICSMAFFQPIKNGDLSEQSKILVGKKNGSLLEYDYPDINQHIVFKDNRILGEQTTESSLSEIWSCFYVEKSDFIIATSYDSNLNIFNHENKQKVHQLKGHTDKVHIALAMPNSKFILSAGKGKELILWSMESFEAIKVVPHDHLGMVRAMVLSKDHQRVITASSADNRLFVWNANSLEREKEIKDCSDEIYCLASCNESGLIAIGGKSLDIHFLEDKTDTLSSRVLKGHTRLITQLIFIPGTSYLLSGSWDGTVRMWNIESGREIARMYEPGFAKFILFNKKQDLGDDQWVLAIGTVLGDIYTMDIQFPNKSLH